MSNVNRRLDQSLTNPCLREHEISLKCLDRNNYDKDLCSNEFENYKRCKEFWSKVVTDRRLQGISPGLPPLEDRARVKQEYLKKFPV